jgi:hypothetical protein
MLLSLLFTLISEAVPTAYGDESLNTTSQETGTTVNIKDIKDYHSGDSYLDKAYEECVVAKETATCVKYEALKYIHELTSPHAEEEGRANEKRPEFKLWGPMKLVPLLSKDIPTDLPTPFSELDSKSTDSEFMRLFRFTLREIGRFVGSYALAISFPNVSSSGRGTEDFETPKFFDDDFFGGEFKEGKNIDKNRRGREMYTLSQWTVAPLSECDVVQFCRELSSDVSGNLLPFSSGWIEDIRSKLHQKVLPIHKTIKWLKIQLNFDNCHADTEVSQTVFKMVSQRGEMCTEHG